MLLQYRANPPERLRVGPVRRSGAVAYPTEPVGPVGPVGPVQPVGPVVPWLPIRPARPNVHKVNVPEPPTESTSTEMLEFEVKVAITPSTKLAGVPVLTTRTRFPTTYAPVDVTVNVLVPVPMVLDVEDVTPA
jgi:hypothetical protein